MTEVKLKKLSVLLGDAEFERFEVYCAQNGYKKSTLAARLIRDHLDKEGSGRSRASSFHHKKTRG